MNKLKIIFATVVIGLAFVLTANAQSNRNSNSNQDSKKDEKTIKDSPLKILKINYPKVNGNCNGNGIVTFKVTFHSSGKVTKVLTVSSSTCEYFNEEARYAAENIRFKPAIKDGVAVTVAKNMQFRFSVY